MAKSLIVFVEVRGGSGDEILLHSCGSRHDDWSGVNEVIDDFIMLLLFWYK